MKSEKQLTIFAFQKIASGIDAEALKCSSASITDAIWPDCWTHYKDINKKHLKFLSKFEPFKKLVNIDYLNFLKIYYNDKKPLKEYIINDKAIRYQTKLNLIVI